MASAPALARAATATSPNQRRWWSLGVLGLSVLVLSMALTVLGLALAPISRDLHASTADLQWVSVAYNLTMVGLMMLAGAVGDRLGRKRVLLAGLSLYGLTSVAAAWAPSVGWLIGYRAIMGIGGAVVMPMAMSLIRSMFGPSEQGLAIGVFSASVAAGMPLGPIVGGVLLEHYWWGSVFLLNAVVVGVTTPVAAALLPEHGSARRMRIDLAGVLLSAVGIGALTYGLIEAGSGWTEPAAVGIVAGLVLTTAFAVWQSRTRQPLLDLALFTRAGFSGPVLVLVLAQFGLAGLMFVVPLYLQGVLDLTPLGAGLRMLPLALGVLVGSLTASRLTAWFGARLTVSAGLVTTALALGTLAGLTPHTGVLHLALGLLLGGLGMGLVTTPLTGIALATVPAEIAGSGSAAINATRQVGGVLGVAVVGSVVSARYVDLLPATVGQLPAAEAAAVRGSVARVAQVGQALGPGVRGAFQDAARLAFTAGMRPMLLTCAAIAVFAAAVCWWTVPGRAGGDP
jgi:EmrB/QacA subfamily drug resistance transporter